MKEYFSNNSRDHSSLRQNLQSFRILAGDKTSGQKWLQGSLEFKLRSPLFFNQLAIASAQVSSEKYFITFYCQFNHQTPLLFTTIFGIPTNFFKVF